ncbi:unnamed protein product [Rodentolepis nana]|uniref:Cyclic nucleotide-binding domain-containing protein n=1 Tax=Rodentolepis nana TaxID=102285 RepID=A0A0R3TWA9_RODNA|nr:unnamed protein product [Rodentolepis nana]
MKVTGQDDVQKEIDIRRMAKGEYFGEKALLGEGRRTANIYAASPEGVELLCLYRKDFLELMGNIADLEHKEYVDLEHLQSHGGQVRVVHPINLNEDDPTVTLTSAGPTSLDQLLGQRESMPAVVGERTAELDALRKLHTKEYDAAADLKLSDIERVAIIGQGEDEEGSHCRDQTTGSRSLRKTDPHVRRFALHLQPILLRAVHLRDLRACDILLSSGALALCCAQKCSTNCSDILDILFEPAGDSDLSISDVSCLLISYWTKFLQKIFAASKSNNAGAVGSLLEEFKAKCCTFRRYTDLCIYFDPMVYEDLREFTLLCMDPHLVPFRQNRIPSDVTPSSAKSFFNMVAEGAGKAFSAFLSVGEQIVGGGIGDRNCMETDLLARRIRNVMTQLTQQYLNAMLISAIERADLPIIHILLDFGFRLQGVPRPSMCFPNAVDISTVVKRENSLETRRNPLEWRLETPGGPDWLLTALQTAEDTPILAAIRKNLLQEDVFDQLLKEGGHLLLLPGAGGILPIHLMAALGRIEMLSAVLHLNDPR